MTAFVYDAGSDGSGGWPQPGAYTISPLAALGLVEFGGIRVHDGTYVLSGLGGITDTPDVRLTLTDRAQDHGAFLAGSYYGPRTITVEGYIMTDYVDQLWPALDRLRQALSIPSAGTLLTVQALQPGWSERRFCLARPAAPLVVAQHAGSDARKPYRDWQAVLVAPDPRLYGITLYDGPGSTTALGTSKTQPNPGTFPAPIKWVVNGPAESPRLTDQTTGREIRYAGPVATGSTLVVDVLERTALLNGNNVYKNLTRLDNVEVPVGGSTMVTTTNATNPGGTWRAEHRATWI